ncbi:hypothetical protein L107_10995 [Cyanobium sp. Copco_Reservoir_LC18]|nr:hypothetical protein L107_10995 [Cyanobium sp. Copco_Reservoir_LC18]
MSHGISRLGQACGLQRVQKAGLHHLQLGRFHFRITRPFLLSLEEGKEGLLELTPLLRAWLNGAHQRTRVPEPFPWIVSL